MPAEGSRDVPPVHRVRLRVNGAPVSEEVPDRLLLSDFLRESLGLVGTRVGCEHGVCGACTVLLDGAAIRSCLMLAAQVDGASITTIEGMADGDLHPIQAALVEEHGLQCGFCTAGIVMSLVDLLGAEPDPSDEQIRELLSGSLCRCTGYQHIVAGVRRAATALSARSERERHAG